MYVMTNCGKLFANELTNWLVYEVGFKQSQCKIPIYYKYAPYVSKLFVLSYLDECLYWYKYEELGKRFVDTPGKSFHMNFLGY